MEAKFIGDPAEGDDRELPKQFEMYGVTFEKNKFAEVPDHLASKFVGNSHFETKGKVPDAPTPQPVTTGATAPVASLAAPGPAPAAPAKTAR